MKILSIETSMGAASVACGCVDSHIFMTLYKGENPAENLLPLIDRAMAESGFSFQNLDRIAVCVGPGGFSGVRTGVAAARGLALAAGVEAVGATSFRIMTEKLLFVKTQGKDHIQFAGPIGLVAAAGRDYLYCQVVSQSGEALDDLQCLQPENAVRYFGRHYSGVTLFGPGAADAGAAAQSFGLTLNIGCKDLLPDASTLARIAPRLDPQKDKPVPFYVRPPDAKAQNGHAIARKPE